MAALLTDCGFRDVGSFGAAVDERRSEFAFLFGFAPSGGDAQAEGEPSAVVGAGRFLAFDAGETRGAVVGAVDRNRDGLAKILVGDGPGSTGRLRGRPRSLVQVRDGLTLAQLDGFFAFDPTFLGGVYVEGT